MIGGGVKQKLTRNDALAFLKVVKETFQDRKEKYGEFVGVMKDFMSQRVDNKGAIARVRELFKGNRELILGFNIFLPPGFEITCGDKDETISVKQHAQFGQAINFVHKLKSRFQSDDQISTKFLKILDMYREERKNIDEVSLEVADLLHNHSDLVEEFKLFLPDSTRKASHVPHFDRNILPSDYSSSPTTTARLVHAGASHADRDVSVNQPEPDHNRALMKFDKELRRHSGKEMDRREDKDRREQDRYAINFDRNDLQHKSHEHKPAYKVEEDCITCQLQQGSLWSDGHLPRSVEVNDRYRERSCERHDKDRECGNRERERFNRVAFGHKDIPGSKMPLVSSKEAIQELDLSDCERCTPSYRLLPKNYPIPSVSQRTDLAAEVLNDNWVSVTSGSEDYSFKHMRKNQYEEILFRCEDDRFELDVLLESVNATINRVEKVLQDMDDNLIRTDGAICLEDHFTALLAEIKEISEIQHREDGVFLSISAGNRQPVVPIFDFEFPDSDIHEYLHQIIKYSCGKFCTAEQSDKIMKVWTTFIEPMFGVPSHLQCEHHIAHLANNVSNTLVPSSGSHTPAGLAALGNCINRANRPGVTDKAIATRGLLVTISSSAEGSDFTREVSSSNITMSEGIRVKKREEESVEKFKIEREEGELSPAAIVKEDHFQEYGDSATEANHEPINGTKNMQYQAIINEKNCFEDGLVENDIDAGQEGAHRLSDERENATQNGAASGSEFADGEDFSHEEHEGDHEEHDIKCESRDEAKGKADAHDVERDGRLFPFSERFLQSVKPLTMHVPSLLQERKKISQIFYGNDSFYILFRFHQILYDRIKSARFSAEKNWGNLNDSIPTDFSTRFINALYGLLDESPDTTKFEDDSRNMMGAQSFVLLTLNKLIHNLVKQLQTVATDEIGNKLLQLYEYEKSRASGTFTDVVYYKNARTLLQDENIYRIECSSKPLLHLSIQLMDYGYENPEETAVTMESNFASYLYNEFFSLVPDKNEKRGIFLNRNISKSAYGEDFSYTCNALEEFQNFNGLQSKISSDSYKVVYILDTEDFLCRKKRRIWCQSASSHDQAYPSARVRRFRKLLSGSMNNGFL